MIELIGVSKYYPTDFGRHYVFRDVSIVLPFDKSVAVIGPNGAGKSTFIRLIAGADIPSEGRIIRHGRISPPMGLTPGLQFSLSGVENARFAGRIYGLDRDQINDMIDEVREISGIGKFFDLPVGTYSAGMRQRVAFAINMSLQFDYYLFDEIAAGGDREFRKFSKAKVQERLKTSKFIIASHRSDELLDLCDAGIVIRDGTLTYFDEVKDALAAYGDDDEEEDGPRRQRSGRTGAEDAAATTQARLDRLERVARIAELRERIKAGEGRFKPKQGEAPALSDEERRRRALERRAVSQASDRSPGTISIAAAPAEPSNAPAALHPVNSEQDGAQPDEAREATRAAARAARHAEIFERRDRLVALRNERQKIRERVEVATVEPDGEDAAGVSVSVDDAARRERIAQRLEARQLRQPRGADQAEPDAVPTPRSDDARAILFRQAVQRQERAQIKAARAARLLLQHLDAVSSGENAGPERRRAALVAAAQDGAAEEAAQARAFLDGSQPPVTQDAPAGLNDMTPRARAAGRRQARRNATDT